MLASVRLMRTPIAGLLGGCCVLTLLGCVRMVPHEPEHSVGSLPVIVGYARALITGDRSRKFDPEVRWFELVNRGTGERLVVEVQTKASWFIVPVPAGRYELVRVQINEGAFLSLANVSLMFDILEGQVTCVGSWRFGIESPRYGRRVLVSVDYDQTDQAVVKRELLQEYPDWGTMPVVISLPSPLNVEARLYEVAPYPRMHKYFRRHWW